MAVEGDEQYRCDDRLDGVIDGEKCGVIDDDFREGDEDRHGKDVSRVVGKAMGQFILPGEEVRSSRCGHG